MKKILSLILYCCLTAAAPCMADTEPAMEIKLTDGTTHVIQLSKRPVITVKDNQLVIECEGTGLGLDLGAVSRYAFREVVTGIDGTRSEHPVLRIEGDNITVSPSVRDTDVTLAAPNGMVLARHSADAGKGCSLSLSGYAPGVYLLTVGSFTTKIAKR